MHLASFPEKEDEHKKKNIILTSNYTDGTVEKSADWCATYQQHQEVMK